MPVSKEAKALRHAARDWDTKPKLVVPARRPVGLNTATYKKDGFSVTESAPSVSSRGRISIPVHAKRIHLLADEADAAFALANLVADDAEPKTYRQAITSKDW